MDKQPLATDQSSPYHQRRLLLAERMRQAGGGVALIPTAPEMARNRDTQFPYRADSYFQYLTGFSEPEAALLLLAGRDAEEFKAILFCREKNAEREIWDGFRHGPDGARERFGFDAAHVIGELDAKLAELIADQPALWFSLGHDAGWDARVAASLNKVRSESRSGKRAPAAIRDVRADWARVDAKLWYRLKVHDGRACGNPTARFHIAQGAFG